MIKTYKITKPCHNYSFILRGKGGNAQRFTFTGGNEMTGTPARLILRTQYSQTVLEESDYFKTGFVKLERTGNGGEKVVVVEPQRTLVEEVTSPEQLIEFVGVTLEKPYKDPKAALRFANSKGYEFPNLTLK